MNYTYDTRNFRESFERDFTYINGFMRNVDRYGNRPALYCPIRDRSYTYSQLNTEVNKLANALAADGVGRGDVVLYSLFNSIEFALCYLAATEAGCGTFSFKLQTCFRVKRRLLLKTIAQRYSSTMLKSSMR